MRNRKTRGRSRAGRRTRSRSRAFVAAIPGPKAVLVLGSNPVLTAPADLNLSGACCIGRGRTGEGRGTDPNEGREIFSIHAGTHEDETAQACLWHVPLAHYLEAWGDVRTL